MNTIKDKKLYTEYFEEIRKKVTEKELNTPSQTYGAINIVTCIFLYIIGLILLPKLPIFVVIIYFYTLCVELGYISHDIIHNQYFKSRKINRFFSYIIANLLFGLSRSWWEKKHNIEHHTFTNSDIHDTDIRDYDEIFTKNEGKYPFFHRYKTILFWIATSLLYFRLLLLSFTYIFGNKKYFEFFLNICNLCLLPGFLVFHFGLVTAIACLLSIYILVGTHLAFVFMTNHSGMEIIDGKRIREYAWLDLQTRTSRNILGGPIIHHLFGGLNKQIEHHLFPQISRENIAMVAQEVKSFCQEKGIQYHEVSFRESIQEVYHTLKTGEVL